MLKKESSILSFIRGMGINMYEMAVIFDLDGVIVSTDEYHYKAWKQLADEEGIYFDKRINELLRGVSRMESLEIILSNSQKEYTKDEKLILSNKKNQYYRELLESLSPNEILPGTIDILQKLKEKSIKIAIGSSSKNARFILNKIGLYDLFDAIADGSEIVSSKPDPEVFLLASKKLGIPPKYCVVVEDATAGVEAAIAGGMKVVGVGYASGNENANLKVYDMTNFSVEEVISLID